MNISISPEKSVELLNNIGICVAPVRTELGIRTVFNILGSLANPAGAEMELMGVYDQELVEPLARVLNNFGVKKAMIVNGNDGLDKISMSAPTTICEAKDGWLRSYEIEPEQFGFEKCENHIFAT